MDFTKKKCLIAYFSHTGMNYTANGIVPLEKGNTEIAAELIQQVVGGDLFQIEKTEEYPYDYKECVEVSKTELQSNARPPLKNPLPSLEEYDCIFLGYPCWCGTAPMPVFSFLDAASFEGKMILPFCTNEGSGMGHSEGDIQKEVPLADVRKGIPIRGSQVESALPKIRLWCDAVQEKR